MADYYTHISLAVPINTKEQYQWWRDFEDFLSKGEFSPYQLSDERYPRTRLWFCGEETSVGFLVSSRWNEDTESGEAWIRDEAGVPNIDLVSDTIHDYMQTFQIPGVITFEWADTCSKPRVDAYGGGVYAITKDAAKSHSTTGLVAIVRRNVETYGELSFETENP